MLPRLRGALSTGTGLTAAVIITMLAVLAVIAPILWFHQASTIDIANAYAKPSAQHWFGTDELGRDIFARALVATRLSLVSALLASIIAIIIGIPVGLLSSAFGPKTSGGFRTVINVSIAFPALLTAMFVGTIIGIGIPGAVLGVGIAMAPLFARLTQTLTTSVIALDYVAAARILGIPMRRVISRHILPNVAEPLVIQATTSVGISLLGISALSFLGLGARPPAYDWGGLLSTGLKTIYTNSLSAIGPGSFIILAGVAFSLLGESIAGTFADNQFGRRAQRVHRSMQRAGAKRTVSSRPVLDSDLVLEVQDLRVGFPTEQGELSAVRGVSLRLGPGERVGVVGESGSGKSVTVMAIAQLLEFPAVVSSQMVRIEGAEITGMKGRALRRFLATRIALVFQNPMSSLNPAMRIGSQVAEPALVHSRLSRKDALAQAGSRLFEVGIDDPARRLRQYPFEFSGGMRQRAIIAMGLMEKPKLIIADEPTTALDVTVQRQILDLLTKINHDDGAAILLISHDIAVISEVCQRVVIMYAGVVVEELPTDRLADAAHPYTRALIASVPDMTTGRNSELAMIPGRPPTLLDIPPGCPFAARCAFVTARCSAESPTLDVVDGDHRVACWHPQRGSAPRPFVEADGAS